MKPVEKLGAEGLRRSGRISKEVAIVLIGCDARGKEFMEQTKTVVLSRHGAGIVSKHTLGAEQELLILHPESSREAEIRVVGQIGSVDGSHTYGVAFLDPDIDFWGVKIPCATEAETSACRIVVQCNTCGRREVIDSGALESDICAIHDGLLRYCKHCNSSTLWKQASGEATDKSALPEAPSVSPDTAASSEPPVPLAPFKNRRQHVRTKVKFTASVRNDALGDDLVLCENVSRGGLCFKSTRRYCEAAGIEIAAPFSPGSHCILVPAQIVYVQELTEEKVFRYGAQYVPLSKDAHS